MFLYFNSSSKQKTLLNYLRAYFHEEQHKPLFYDFFSTVIMLLLSFSQAQADAFAGSSK